MSKWGVRALARQLELENRDLAHVHVSCVSPGGVDTPIYETGRQLLRLRRPSAAARGLARARRRVRILRLLDQAARPHARSARPTHVMRVRLHVLPGVYDALVGPLFGVAAIDRTTPRAARPGQRAVPGGRRQPAATASQPGPLVAIGRNLATLVRGAATAVTSDGLRRRRDRRRPQRTGRRQPPGRRRLVGRSCWRPSPTWAARSPATATCTRTSCTTPSARSTRWPRRRRRSRRSASSDHGLAWRHAPAVLGHPLPDGSWALLHRDRARHRRPARRPARRRRRGLARAVRAVGRDRRPARSAPCSRRSHRSGVAAATGAEPAPRRRARLRQDPADPGRRRWATSASAATHPRLLLAGNAGHADIPLDAPGSGLMGIADVDARPDRRLPGARRAAPGRWPPALADRFTQPGRGDPGAPPR